MKLVSCLRCSMEQIRLFEKASHIDGYFKFRPTYPPELFQRIISYLNEKKPPPHQLAVDVGCGSGQSTYGISTDFQRVIGYDVSSAQVEAATKANTITNVEFKLSPAETLPLDDNSVDLITCAQAAHWLDFEAFCKEAKRVLKPNGCLAIFGYGVPWLDHKDENTKAKLAQDFDQIYSGDLGSFWNARRRHIDQKYAELPLPFSDFIRDDSFEMRNNWPVSHMIGYLGTWSAYQKYLVANPMGHVLLEDFQKKLLAAVATPDALPSDTMLEVVAPVFLLLGRNSEIS